MIVLCVVNCLLQIQDGVFYIVQVFEEALEATELANTKIHTIFWQVWVCVISKLNGSFQVQEGIFEISSLTKGLKAIMQANTKVKVMAQFAWVVIIHKFNCSLQVNNGFLDISQLVKMFEV